MKNRLLTVREIFLSNEEIKEAVRYYLIKEHNIIFSDEYKIENWGYTGDMRIEIMHGDFDDTPKTV